jgi:hypothetical protein
MASATTTGGGVAVMLAEHWHSGAPMPAAAAARQPARRDCLALEREVASLSLSHSW